jgi:septal ring factor EnvC (AmiA/AmiB activator)
MRQIRTAVNVGHSRARVRLLGACLTLLAAVHGATAQPSAPQRDAESRIRELQIEADRLAAESGTLLGELRKLEIERELKRHALRKAHAELNEMQQAVTRASARVRALESERVAETAGLRERLAEIYKRGRSGYVRLLLAADDLRALGRMTRAVAAVNALDQLRFDAHRRTIRAEIEALSELETRRESLADSQAQARQAREALDIAIAAHNRRIDEIDQRRDLAAQYVGELQLAAAELDKQVSAFASPAAAPLRIEPFRGALDWPVAGPVLSRFGRGTTRTGDPIDRSGIEIGAADGAEVRAVHAGTVSFAAPFAGFGTLVIVDHGGDAFTLYGHLRESAVTAGAQLERGAVVGRTGRTPEGTEAIYFEVRIDGRAVNPLLWLRAAPP